MMFIAWHQVVVGLMNDTCRNILKLWKRKEMKLCVTCVCVNYQHMNVNDVSCASILCSVPNLNKQPQICAVSFS